MQYRAVRPRETQVGEDHFLAPAMEEGRLPRDTPALNRAAEVFMEQTDLLRYVGTEVAVVRDQATVLGQAQWARMALPLDDGIQAPGVQPADGREEAGSWRP